MDLHSATRREYLDYYNDNAVRYPHVDNFGPDGPHWHRTRFYLDHIGKEDRVLDCGCANGGLAKYLTEAVGCHVTAIDIAAKNAAVTAMVCPASSAAAADIERLPLADECFEVVIAGEILEHVQDLGAAIAELGRVLVPGGRLLATTPKPPYDGGEQHIRRLDRDALWAAIPGSVVLDVGTSWAAMWQKPGRGILEDDVVMGTFTHRATYYPDLIESVKKYCPHIPFILQYDRASIRKNMAELRDKFIATNKRFWLFLDDDIRFIQPNTVRIAVDHLVAHKLGMVGVYSTFDPGFVPGSRELVFQFCDWVPGYFQMVDRTRVGHIPMEAGLPDPNTAVDTSYCVSVQATGWRVGVAPAVVYHTKKEVWMNAAAAEKTNAFMWQKWGSMYFDLTASCPVVIDQEVR